MIMIHQLKVIFYYLILVILVNINGQITFVVQYHHQHHQHQIHKNNQLHLLQLLYM